MNAGKLDTRVEVREYVAGAWVPAGHRFAAIEYMASVRSQGVIFSPLATRVPGVTITLRENAITLHHAIVVDGQHYMLTAAVQAGRRYTALTGAAVTVTPCQMQRQIITGKDALNKPLYGSPQIADFEAVLSEAYVAWQRERPQMSLDQGVILTAPKAILLRAGDLVKTPAATYAVRECHTMGHYQNDYEIVWQGDA